jgi:hypothetical protein
VATPLGISALTTGLTAAQLKVPPNDGGWSLLENLAHLRACADVWGNCIVVIISQDRPTLRAVNPRTWIKKTDYLEAEFQFSLYTFTQQRDSLLAVLMPLTATAWNRKATVTGAGRVLKRSVWFYAHWLARHERQHLKQIERTVDDLRR